jgi:hypothetical protein
MSNRYLNTSPLPYENDAALTLFAEERSSFDVVESALAPDSRLHSDLEFRSSRPRGFVAPTLFDVTGNHLGSKDDDELSDDDAIDQSDRDREIGQDHVDYIVGRQELLQRDHDERQACRSDVERERAERRALRNSRTGHRLRRRTPPRSRKLDVFGERVNQPISQLRRRYNSGRQSGSGGLQPGLSTGNRFYLGRDVAHVATYPEHLKRLVAPLQGVALAIYFVLLPYVVVTRWHRTQRQNDGTLVRALLIALALFWLVFFYQVVRDVWRIRRGVVAGTGGSAWLASALIALLSFFGSSAAGASSVSTVHHSNVERSHTMSSLPENPVKSPTRRPDPWSSGAGIMPLALMAKRRSDLIRQHQFVDITYDVDESIELLRALNPDLLRQLRHMIGEHRDGVVDVPNAIQPVDDAHECVDACVACALGPSPFGTLVSFAREGGVLAILPTWSSDDVVEAVVALHNGRLVFADNELELLRALATRSVRNSLVVYLGDRDELDDDLVACSITLTPYSERPPAAVAPSWSALAPQSRDGDVLVELLRAEPHLVGLREPLTPTLRRRGVEMLAYLAMHRHEPITGERLRSRVLTHADVDASLRTLANTASVVRRSAGSDGRGPRLHAVTSSGLYVTHGITSDVEIFTNLISRARQLTNADAAPLVHQALAMVKGEPLASALRGFEWFLAEGFAARLSRDGEWAALALHHDALVNERYEMAFWALQQGLLIDPYSDVLLEASVRVPRLREFGRDRAGLAQHEAVGASRAVTMSWSLNGFSNQVTE